MSLWGRESALAALGAMADSGSSFVPLAGYGNGAIIHGLKIDKKGEPRTFCGVPITKNCRFLDLGPGEKSSLTCPTCAGATSKPTKAPGQAVLSKSITVVSECNPVGPDGMIIVRGQHTKAFNWATNRAFCSWCGQTIDGATPLG